MKEEWKEYLPGYWISNMGRVWSEKTKIIMNPCINKYGYKQCVVTLGDKKHIKAFTVHRAVAILFVENPNNYKIVNHKNGIKIDNRFENLEWCTIGQNIKHAYDNGLHSTEMIRGENHKNSKLKESDVIYIRNNYKKWSREFGSFALAKIFNISESTVLDIVNRRRWKHI